MKYDAIKQNQFADSIKKIYETKLHKKVLNLIDKSKGFENKVFFVKTNKDASVIRIPINQKISGEPKHLKGKYQALRECWASKAWCKLNIPVPEILLLDDSQTLVEFPYVIETKINGADLSEAKLEPNQLKQIMAELGHYLKKMHAVKTKNYGFLNEDLEGEEDSWRFLDDWITATLKKLKSEKLLSASQLSKIKKYFAANSNILDFSKPSLLHGDIQANNLIVKDGKLAGIIDLGDAMSGDPVYDLARAYQGLSQNFQSEILNHLIKAYGKINKDNFNYYLLYHLCWTLDFFQTEHMKANTKRTKQLITQLLFKHPF